MTTSGRAVDGGAHDDGELERRTTSSAWNTTFSCSCSPPVSHSLSSSVAAVRPISSAGCRTLVNGTAAVVAN